MKTLYPSLKKMLNKLFFILSILFLIPFNTRAATKISVFYGNGNTPSAFSSKTQENNILLEWMTSRENNNDYFTVERSTNGVDFEEVTTVMGAGSSSSNTDYSAIDPKPLKGVSYYRIKQTDYDGKFTYSILSVVKTEESAPTEFRVYPNPSGTDQQIAIIIPLKNEERGELNVTILNSDGTMVYKKTINENESNFIETIQLPGALKPGIYYVGLESRKAVLKQKLVVY